MVELLMNAIVWLFDLSVFIIVMSLFFEVAMPGKFRTLHNIYKVILDFEEDEEP